MSLIRPLVLILLVLVPSWSSAGPFTFTFTKIADTNTQIPGKSDTFAAFGLPVIDGDRIAFAGGDDSPGPFFTPDPFNRGIYLLENGQLRVVADTTTAVPGGNGTFRRFSHVSLDGEDIAFGATDMEQGSDADGIYARIGGELRVIADRTTPIPGAGGAGAFGVFVGGILTSGDAQPVSVTPVIDAQSVAFWGGGELFDPLSGNAGVYLFEDGSIRLLARSSLFEFPLGHGPPLVDLDAGNVAFRDEFGIHAGVAGQESLLIPHAVQVPTSTGGQVLATSVEWPLLDGRNLLFSARRFGPDFEGVFRVNLDNLKVEVVLDTQMLLPSVGADILAFAAEGGNAAILVSDDRRRLFARLGGEVVQVLASGDVLDGRQVQSVLLSPEGMSGTSIVLGVTFVDDPSLCCLDMAAGGSFSIYRADLALAGDYNASGTVEQADLDLVLLHWGQSAVPVPGGWLFNVPSGLVDQDELDMVLLGWGSTLTTAVAPLFATSTPEPSTLLLLMLGISSARATHRWAVRGSRQRSRRARA